MSEHTRHTPGPWRTFERPMGIEILRDNRLAPIHWPSAGLRVAEVRFRRSGRGGSFVGNAVDEANARLIAAAPDMACDGQFLLDRLDEFERDGLSGYGEREWIDHVAPAIARFRAAIAKALPAPPAQGSTP